MIHWFNGTNPSTPDESNEVVYCNTGETFLIITRV